MGSLNQVFEFPEKICYVQCGFCTTILLVSVPSCSLSMVVTVRCGHCSSLLSVNMMKASFIPLQLLASFSHDEAKEGYPTEVGTGKDSERRSSSPVNSNSDNEDEDLTCVNRIVNKPPEKRQRAPSAYNRFIKEEIRRLKSQNPNMAHKEAFSQAAKNETKNTAARLRKEERTHASSLMQQRFTERAKVTVKERWPGILYGKRHPLIEAQRINRRAQKSFLF